MGYLKVRWLKGSWFILIGFVILAVLDFYSTFSNELKEYLEVNPVFLVAGWWPVILLNLLALWILLKVYSSKKIFNRFHALTTFVWLSFLRTAVVINNFKIGEQVTAGEITKETIVQVSDAVKTEYYFNFIVAGMLAPMLVTYLIYWIFILDHKVEERIKIEKLS